MSGKHNNKNQNFIRGSVQQYRSDSDNAWYIQFRTFVPCLLSKISEYVLILYCVNSLKKTILFEAYKILIISEYICQSLWNNIKFCYWKYWCCFDTESRVSYKSAAKMCQLCIVYTVTHFFRCYITQIITKYKIDTSEVQTWKKKVRSSSKTIFNVPVTYLIVFYRDNNKYSKISK